MFTLGTHFEKLLSNTLPQKNRLDAAKELPGLVRDHLQEHDGFETIEPHSRLTGSYAHDTCSGDVKDVDVAVRIPWDTEDDEDLPEARQVLSDLKAALEDFAETTKYGAGHVELRAQGRSVRVHFTDHSFFLDVVPVIAPDGIADILYVPNRATDDWIESCPVGFIDLLNDLNNDHGKKIKKLIRLLKHLRNHHMVYKRPKSYWLSALIVNYTQDGSLDTSKSLAEVFYDLLAEIYSRYACLLGKDDDSTPNIKDPKTGVNISADWSRNDFECFMRHVKQCRDWASEALGAEEKSDAVELWQRVFGSEWFPSQVDEEASSLAAMATPGKSYVTGLGAVTAVKSLSEIVTASRSTRFHGGVPSRLRIMKPNNLALETLHLQKRFPGFTADVRPGRALWRGRLQPRECSPLYEVEISYTPGCQPKVKVLSPRPVSGAPHMYRGGFLCLHYSKDRNWTPDKLIAETILPWTALWLFYYELWLDTGEWLGPQSPHVNPVTLRPECHAS